MTGRRIGERLQGIFDWCEQCLCSVETRWLVFLSAVVVLVAMRAIGAHGLSTLLALIYVMYFVTLERDRSHRDL
jgi:hypothetical protein